MLHLFLILCVEILPIVKLHIFSDNTNAQYKELNVWF